MNIVNRIQFYFLYKRVYDLANHRFDNLYSNIKYSKIDSLFAFFCNEAMMILLRGAPALLFFVFLSSFLGAYLPPPPSRSVHLGALPCHAMKGYREAKVDEAMHAVLDQACWESSPVCILPLTHRPGAPP